MFRLIPIATFLLAAPAVATPAAAVPAPAPAPAPAAAGPLEVTSKVLVEQRAAAADGTTRTRLVPAARAVPGDRLTVAVAYRNTGRAPIGNLAITNPVPAGLSYRGVAPGVPVPEVSIDGTRFAPLAALNVGGRPAVAADITYVRWRLASPVAPGSGGQFAFQAILK